MELDKQTLNSIDNMMKDPRVIKQMKRFWIQDYWNHHITLCQNFNNIELQVYVGRDDLEQYDWLITIHILFWGISFSWNGRKTK